MEDNKIIELYFARDEQAISETDAKYGGLCRSVARNILGNAEDSEECLNDAYLGLWNGIPPVHPKDLRAYACGITRNLALKKLEYQTREKRYGGVMMSFEELEGVLQSEHISIEFSEEDIASLISGFLRGESSDARRVFVRRYYFFDSVKDICLRYSFSESKVKNLLMRTRNRLRKYLKDKGVSI